MVEAVALKLWQGSLGEQNLKSKELGLWSIFRFLGKTWGQKGWALIEISVKFSIGPRLRQRPRDGVSWDPGS